MYVNRQNVISIWNGDIIRTDETFPYEIPVFLIFDMVVRNFVSTSSLTGECAAQKLKNFCSSSPWTCLHHMVILLSYNKITDF